MIDIDFVVEEENNDVAFELEEENELSFEVADVVVHSTNDYAPLINKPMINFNVLEAGNNTYEYLGVEPTIVDITEQDIDQIIFN